MATTVESTTARTLRTLTGYPIPATVNQQTNLNDLPIAAGVYPRLNEGKTASDTVFNVFDAMRDSNAVVTLYADGKGAVDARVLWPVSISFTGEKNIVTRAYCTLRREHRTFRLDRMVSCHPLTTPDDYACGEGQEEARRAFNEEIDHEAWQAARRTDDATVADGVPFSPGDGRGRAWCPPLSSTKEGEMARKSANTASTEKITNYRSLAQRGYRILHMLRDAKMDSETWGDGTPAIRRAERALRGRADRRSCHLG